MEHLEHGTEVASAKSAFDLWSRVALDNGFHDLLSAQDGFGRSTRSGRRWGNRDKPGIYFWLAQNGEAYVGQSVRPMSRLRQHMRAHGDIVHAAFQRCSRGELDRLEQKLIDSAGRHFPLRNIKFALSTATRVPFDDVVSPEEQDTFLAGGDLPEGAWSNLEQLTRLQSHKFERFLALERATEAINAVGTFVDRVIPKPAATESAFWSVTIMPERRFLRVNAGQQEVFTFELGSAPIRVLTDERVRWLRSWRIPYQTRSFVTRVPSEQLSDWLTGRRLLSARRLVVRLMRHTQALNFGSHCPQVVRHGRS